MDKPGTSGALVKMEGFSSGANSTLVYFGCADCSVEAARVVQFGGRIQREKTSIGQYGFMRLLMTPKEICLGCTRCNETPGLTNHSTRRMSAAAAG